MIQMIATIFLGFHLQCELIIEFYRAEFVMMWCLDDAANILGYSIFGRALFFLFYLPLHLFISLLLGFHYIKGAEQILQAAINSQCTIGRLLQVDL